MDKMSISGISQKIFKTAPQKEQNQTNHTNPFGVSFKGNVLTSDVFETSKKSEVSFGANLLSKAADKRRMVTSALVGAMGDVNNIIKTRLNSVADFGRRIKQNVVDTWKQVKDLDMLAAKEAIKSTMSVFRTPSAKQLASELEVQDLRAMMKDELATLGGN